MRDKIMLAKPIDWNKIKTWRHIIAQPKLDGIRCRARWQEGSWKLYSSQDNIIDSCPHINEYLSEFLPSYSHELDGELYCHKVPFQDLCSIIKRKSIHPNHHIIQYYIFDSMSGYTQECRINEISRMFMKIHRLEPLTLVESTDLDPDNDEMITKYTGSILSQGYEGIIFRDPDAFYERKRSSSIYKWKPNCEDSYVVVGSVEEISIEGKPKNRLGAFKVTDGTNVFTVGSGLTDAQRTEYWENPRRFIGRSIRVKYQELSKTGVPRFPIFISLQDYSID